MKTQAAVLYKLNAPLKLETIEVPLLKTGQVLVRVLASGICRSQINEIKGFRGEDANLPHLLGHEGTGRVHKIGPHVKKVKVGDQVVLSWIKGSGLSSRGAVYKIGQQSINSGPIATLSEYAVISEDRLTKIPKTLPAPVAALLGCAVLTGAGIIKNTVQVRADSAIAIFGVGGVGASAILGAVMSECKKIIAIDIKPSALDFARKLGATHALLFSEQIIDDIHSISPRGVDYAIEASGNKSAMEKAIAATTNTGTTVIAGNLPRFEKICLNPFDLIKGKRIQGTWGGESKPDIDIPYYIKMFRKGKIDLDALITRKFKLKEINQALEFLQSSQSAGRIIINSA